MTLEKFSASYAPVHVGETYLSLTRATPEEGLLKAYALSLSTFRFATISN